VFEQRNRVEPNIFWGIVVVIISPGSLLLLLLSPPFFISGAYGPDQ
jgi:hypothetical protein